MPWLSEDEERLRAFRFLNESFEPAPGAHDRVTARIVLRPLTRREMRMVRERRLDVDLECWAMMTA